MANWQQAGRTRAWKWDTKHKGKTLNNFHTEGWGGQRAIVIPDLELVVVMTDGNYTCKTHTFKIGKILLGDYSDNFILAKYYGVLWRIWSSNCYNVSCRFL